MTILLNNNGYDNESWRRELRRQLPEWPVKVYGETIDPEEVTYAMVWNHPAGDLRRYPNLRAIFALGAGAEHFVADKTLPDVPIVLLADPAVARDMAAHALYWVLTFHRRYDDYRAQQCSGVWQRKDIVPADQFHVGILGLGRIGSEVARRIRDFGYAVSGWNRNERQIDDVDCFHGAASIGSFLGANDVVINTLPLSPRTRHFLDAEKFAAMRSTAYLVNISRGAVIDDEALLDALNHGRLAGAALDAFAEEPLPAGHCFWAHSRVFVTPHMAGATYAVSAVSVIAENLRRVERGAAPYPVFDRQMGY